MMVAVTADISDRWCPPGVCLDDIISIFMYLHVIALQRPVLTLQMPLVMFKDMLSACVNTII